MNDRTSSPGMHKKWGTSGRNSVRQRGRRKSPDARLSCDELYCLTSQCAGISVRCYDKWITVETSDLFLGGTHIVYALQGKCLHWNGVCFTRDAHPETPVLPTPLRDTSNSHMLR